MKMIIINDKYIWEPIRVFKVWEWHTCFLAGVFCFDYLSVTDYKNDNQYQSKDGYKRQLKPYLEGIKLNS